MQGPASFVVLQAQQVIISNGGAPGNGIFVYTGTPGIGNIPTDAIVASGITTDPFGNSLSTTAFLVQAGIVTLHGGIFRTAAAAPLIQVDGIHNAILLYDASSNLTETIASVVTNDGLGNTVQQGFTAYQTGTNPNFAQLLNYALLFGAAAFLTKPAVSSNAATAQLDLSSGTITGVTQQGNISVRATNVAGGFQAVVNGPLGIAETSAPAANPSANIGAIRYTSTHGQARYVSDAANGDSGLYDTGTAHVVNSSAVTIGTTATTCLSSPNSLGVQAYKITGDFTIQLGTTATALTFQLTGPTVGALTSVKWAATAGGAGGMFTGRSIGGLGAIQLPATATFAASSLIRVWLSAYITITAASILNVTVLTTVASATTSFEVGNTLDISPVG